MPKGMLSPRFAFISTLSGNRDPADDLILAIDKLTNGRWVVIKRHTIPSSLMADRRALLIACDKFLCLSHSGIARPIDVLVDRKGGVIQTVVEYFPGKSFIETLKSLSSEHFLLAIAQCCSALHFLHSRNYAHLDLHPGNLVMIPEIESEMPWSVKLIDLPFLPLQELRRHRDLLHFNPKFSAPEIISGSDFDHRADLYSFGALLYAALVGDLPEVSSSSLQPHSLGRDEEQPHTDLIAPDYLASIVRKLLYKDPQKRHGSFFFLLSDR